MFKKFLMIGLLCIGVFALLGTQATAGCINLPGGGKFCASWIRGTTDLDVLATGQGNNPCAKDPDADCAQFSGAIYGTIQNPDDPITDSCGDDGALDEDCLIAVTAICGPKKCLKNPNRPGCQNMNFNSSHFSFDAIGVKFSDFDDCKRNGKCTGLLEFLADVAPDVCTPGHVLIDALAVYYNGEACFCDEPFDVNGSCPSGAQCIVESCEIDPANSETGDAYTCSGPVTIPPWSPQL